MKRLTYYAALAAVLAIVSCTTGGGTQPSGPVRAGAGALAISVTPNPIIARNVSGNTYDFPFTISLREVGGVAVQISDVNVDVTALGGLKLYSQSYDAAEIARRGYPTSIGANGQISYQLNPRKDVPDDRLFEAVQAELTVHGVDVNGAPTTARTTVTVRR